MQKKTILVVLLLVALINFSSAEEGPKGILMPELVNPGGIEISGNDLYIAEGATIRRYSLKDMKLLKKFGREGEGPGEFKLYPFPGFAVEVRAHTDYIIVNSIGRISHFTRDGKFIKEQKLGAFRNLRPAGENYIGFGSKPTDKKTFRTINLYNPELEEIKELIRREYAFQQGKSFKPVGTRIVFAVGKDRIFASDNSEFEIKGYDLKGNYLKSIRKDTAKHKITSEDKIGCRNWFKKYDPNWPHIKDIMKFPDYYPPIRILYVDSQNLYVKTYVYRNDEAEFFIFDINGKFIKRVFLPLIKKSWVAFFPCTIHNGKLYQLVDNSKEEWILKIYPIK